MIWKNWTVHIFTALFILISIVFEMCFYKKVFKPNLREKVIDHIQHGERTGMNTSDVVNDENGYTCGMYYSNWSPYSPRFHYPHDIDLSKLSHLYYAFFLVDGDTGEVKSSDEWSDFGLDAYKPLVIRLNKINHENTYQNFGANNLPVGLIGELNFLRHSKIMDDENKTDFKLIMSVGGWSNRAEFPKLVRDEIKLNKFIESCVDTMFKYGFDGIDLDWEFPNDDGFEPAKYLEITQRLRRKLDQLETNIFGNNIVGNHAKFQLSMATPAFNEKLSTLPIVEMDKFIDTWNMMTYDYYGEWSESTGYHCNLYDGSAQKRRSLFQRSHSSQSSTDLNGNAAITYMVEKFGINPNKITLGMAAYGRGFTNVKKNNVENEYIGKQFEGVGGAAKGEPGMWLYNQLPIKGSQEFYDPEYVAAYCFGQTSKTFVAYDNPASVREKAQYIKKMKLAGGFWWESCGDTHNDPSRSLLNAFSSEIRSIKKSPNSIFHHPKVLKYYLSIYGNDGFLSSLFLLIAKKT